IGGGGGVGAGLDVEAKPRAPRLVDLLSDAIRFRSVFTAERGHERLELVADAPHAVERLLARQLSTTAPAVEETVARRTEALPQCVGLGSRRVAAGLPFRLELLDGRRRGLPIGGIGERLGLDPLRLLPLRGP